VARIGIEKGEVLGRENPDEMKSKPSRNKKWRVAINRRRTRNSSYGVAKRKYDLLFLS